MDPGAALRSLIHPTSVAIVGASEDPGSYASRPLRYLADFGYSGTLAAVNPRRSETYGVATFPSIADLPYAPDVALLLINARAVPDAVRACGELGVQAVISVASGFSESGNAELDADLTAAVEESGVRLLGPNCIGLINRFDNAYLTFSTVLMQTLLEPGPIAMVAQSGALTNVILQTCAARGIGIGYAITTGNETDLELGELVSFVLEDPRISVMLCYVEVFKSHESMKHAARRAQELGKALIVTKGARSSRGAAASLSHTGKIGGDGRVWDSVATHLGIIATASLDSMIDCAEIELARLGRRMIGVGG